MNLLALYAFASAALATGPDQQPSSTMSTQPVRIETDRTDDRENAQNPEERRLCRYVPTTGTRTSNRICLTRQQWREFDRNN